MKIPKRRRKENKTDYLKRIELLKGGKPRIVFRKTNKYLVVQYVTSENAQDKIEIGMDSRILLKYSWPKKFSNSLKSIPAAYLLGVLVAKKIKKMEGENPIVDFGMIKVLHKSKPYSFLKGLIDGGIKINCSKDMFPEQERIEGKNLKQDFSKEFEKIKKEIEQNE